MWSWSLKKYYLQGTVLLRPDVWSCITAKKIPHLKCFSFGFSDFFWIFFDQKFPNRWTSGCNSTVINIFYIRTLSHCQIGWHFSLIHLQLLVWDSHLWLWTLHKSCCAAIRELSIYYSAESRSLMTMMMRIHKFSLFISCIITTSWLFSILPWVAPSQCHLVLLAWVHPITLACATLGWLPIQMPLVTGLSLSIHAGFISSLIDVLGWPVQFLNHVRWDPIKDDKWDAMIMTICWQPKGYPVKTGTRIFHTEGYLYFHYGAWLLGFSNHVDWSLEWIQLIVLCLHVFFENRYGKWRVVVQFANSNLSGWLFLVWFLSGHHFVLEIDPSIGDHLKSLGLRAKSIEW